MAKAFNKFANSLLAICLGIGFSVAAAPLAQAADQCISGFTLVGDGCEIDFSYSDGAKALKFPQGLGEIEIEAYGAAGGAGGLDGGSCVRANGGDAGYLFIREADMSNKILRLFPGDKGKDGANSVTASGAGPGGNSLIAKSYAGARGGNAGPVGTSGGGGGGGAATVVEIGNERFVAAGAGGGGGCAGSANGSTSGTTNSNYEDTSNGSVGYSTTVNQQLADGGGGGGGGGGVLGGTGGVLFKAANGETGGYGGNAGSNTPAGNKVAVSKYVSTTSAGKVVVRYFPWLGAKSVELVGSNPTSANAVTFKLTLNSRRDLDTSDIILSGSIPKQQPMLISITSDKPVQAPYTYNFRVEPRDPKFKWSGTLMATVFDVSSALVSVDAAPPIASINFDNASDVKATKEFNVFFNEKVQGLTKASFKLAKGTAKNCSISEPSGEGSRYRVSIAGCTQGTVGLILKQSSVKDLMGNPGPALETTSGLIQPPPLATIDLQPGSLKSNSHVYDVRFDQVVTGLSTESFQIAYGSSKSCKVGYVIGSGKYFQVALDNCTDGTFGIILPANAVVSAVDKKGPLTQIESKLDEQSTKATSVTVLPGEIPKTIEPSPVSTIFGSLDDATKQTILDLGVFAPNPSAPTSHIRTELVNSTVDEKIQLTSTQKVEVGSSVRLTLNVSPEIAASSDVVAFMQTEYLWQYLGRTSFTNNAVTSDDFTLARLGKFNIRLVIIGKDVVTNMSLPKTSGFGQGLGHVKTAVSSDQTLLSPQTIDIDLQAVAGPNGVPEIIDPSLNPEVPGAQTDDNAASQTYDALATPEGVEAVAKSVGTAIAVAGSVAGAVAGATAGAGAASSGGARMASSSPSASASSGGSSSASSSSGSSSSASSSAGDSSKDSSSGDSSKKSSSGGGANAQNTDSSDGSIESLDSEVESFTTVNESWGDKIPIFRLRALTFLDTFTHDLTVRLARFSPVFSKVVNDGAYLRSVLGSLWLALPVTGLALAIIALMQPSVELRPPVWQLFLAIAVLGIFDALAGMLATLVYSIGMISIYGIHDLSDIRLMLGVIVLGFGPVLIGVSFRAIRKHYETNINYLWNRLVDLAVLTFFVGWSVSGMIATLPALAGRTLAVANYGAEFSLWMAVAIAIRIILEELAARGFSKRLDTINPTEVPSTSQIQKVISTAVKLFMFIFVTAAFMGNVWQVWVGSFIFILPNILSWFQDKFPNSPLLWKMLPQGVPGLALTLIISAYTATVISGWLEGTPEYPQYRFMLAPIPIFLLGLLGMFGREGKEDEERPLFQDRWRWVYRIGGIVILPLTMKLAGFI